jgi:hypothetical protein
MAKRIKNGAKLGDLFQDIMIQASTEMQQEMEVVMPKAARIAEVTYKREMQLAGIKRSSETGTRDKRSSKMSSRPSSKASVYDTASEVYRLPNGGLRARGGSSDDSEYRALILDKGTKETMKYWGNDSGEQLDGARWMNNAVKIANHQVQAEFEKAFQKGLRRMEEAEKRASGKYTK